MKRSRWLTSCVVAVCALAAAPSAKAIILFGLDNTANQTDPGTGAQFDAVGLLSDENQANPSGSAIHLGGGYMLTAHHVGMKPYVTFDGSTFYQRDLSFSPVQVAANVDMQVFKLSTVPTVSAVNLYGGTNEEVAPATMVGWGVGRDSAVLPNSVDVTWGDATTVAKRWGLNVPRSLTGIDYQSGSYQALVTVLGSAAGTPAGLGVDEAAATVFDSGSALFQNLGGTWYLIGLTTAVETGGTSHFGNEAPDDPNGDLNAFARISTYRNDIVALIPEPSSVALLTAGLTVLATRRRRH